VTATIRCECNHTHRSHYNDGRCGLCACPKYRRVLECAECGEDLGLDCGLGDDEGALCCGCCGTEYARERADVRDETAYEANRDNGFGVL
jgi:hypothetical protein